MPSIPTRCSTVCSSIVERILTPIQVPTSIPTKAGQKRFTTEILRSAWENCQRLATTTGIAIIAIAVCGGTTIAIIGTVNKGVPTPSAPLMKPPQHNAKKHQTIIQKSNSANNLVVSNPNAAYYQLGNIREDRQLTCTPGDLKSNTQCVNLRLPKN